MQQRIISLFGLFAMVGIAWLLSSHKTKISWRIVSGGITLQFLLAVFVFYTPPGQEIFQVTSEFLTQLLGYVDVGTGLVFGIHPQEKDPELPPSFLLLRTIAFGVLPSIIFFSSLMAILYHWGVMQRVVSVFAWIMQKTLNTSGAESLCAAANIFVGQTEAPLVVRPYVTKMTQSELMAVMVAGFATIAGGVMAIYVGFGIEAGHLMAASVISAPAALLIAKVMMPETEQPETVGSIEVPQRQPTSNVIEAVAIGATDGMKLAINVAARLIAFLALIAMLDAAIGWSGGWFGF